MTDSEKHSTDSNDYPLNVLFGRITEYRGFFARNNTCKRESQNEAET